MNKSLRQKTTKVLSEQGKRNIAEGAARRSRELVARNTAVIREQMGLIEAELSANAGVYPHKAKLGVTELCRRAGLGPKLLFAPVYAEFLAEIRQWLHIAPLKSVANYSEPVDISSEDAGSETGSRKRSKGARPAREVAIAWKSAYEDLLVQHLKTTDELMLERHKSKKRIEQLEAQVEELQEQVSEAAKLHVLSLVKG